MVAKISLDKKARQEIAQILSRILADTYLLYLKTQNFHWNVVDPRFSSLHLLFESQYEELADAVDGIAERIRMIEHKTPASFKEFSKLASLKEDSGDYSGDKMIQLLCQDHETLADQLRPQIDRTTELKDHGTADLFIGRLKAHEKAAWMLRSSLK